MCQICIYISEVRGCIPDSLYWILNKELSLFYENVSYGYMSSCVILCYYDTKIHVFCISSTVRMYPVINVGKQAKCKKKIEITWQEEKIDKSFHLIRLLHTHLKCMPCHLWRIPADGYLSW